MNDGDKKVYVGETKLLDDVLSKYELILEIVKANMGSGSGFDADLLDGKDSTEFATKEQGKLADSSLQKDQVLIGNTVLKNGQVFLSTNDITVSYDDQLEYGGQYLTDIFKYLKGIGSKSIEVNENKAIITKNNGGIISSDIPIATESNNGYMPKEVFAQINKNSLRIQNLEQAGIYRGSFDTLDLVPKKTDDPAFNFNDVFVNDYVHVRSASEGGKEGIARYTIINIDGSKNITWNFDIWLEKNIPTANNSGELGLVTGANTNGKISVGVDGSMSLVGYNSIITDLNNKLTSSSIVDNLTTNDASKSLSAKQGKVLQDNKVNIVTGKGLSTNDFSNDYKDKIDNAIANLDIGFGSISKIVYVTNESQAQTYSQNNPDCLVLFPSSN